MEQYMQLVLFGTVLCLRAVSKRRSCALEKFVCSAFPKIHPRTRIEQRPCGVIMVVLRQSQLISRAIALLTPIAGDLE